MEGPGAACVGARGIAVLSAYGVDCCGAAALRKRMAGQAGANIPHGTIHRILKEWGLAGTEPKKGKRRVGAPRAGASDSLWRADRKQLHAARTAARGSCATGTTPSGSTGYGVSGEATAENALAVLEQAIRDHGRPASVMTGHRASPAQTGRRSGEGEYRATWWVNDF